MLTFADYLNHINRAIAEIQYPESPRGLYEPIEYTLEGSGKRIRPVLLLAASDACGGTVDGCINQAMGLEMFHNFTLLHDDVMDRSDLRRGRPTVHRRWNESTAILSGDAMLTMATKLTVERCPPESLADLITLFNATAMEIYEGQQYDMDFEQRDDVTVEEYLEMIRLKTSVLLGYACQAGALMAGAPEEVQQALYAYGESLGLAFQLRDDWLDTFGDPDTFGKAIGGDILNDKKTFLRISSMERTWGKQRELILRLNGVRSPEKISLVKGLYLSTGAESDCLKLIDRYGKEAITQLGKANLGEEAMRFFTELAVSTLNRTK